MTPPPPTEPEDWQRVQHLLAELLELGAAEREAALSRSNASPAVTQRVRELLRALQESPDYLEPPPREGASAPADAAAASLAPGTRIGAWRVENLLGRGGMGEVYRATRADGAYQQQVAIKLVGAHAVAHIERFHAERRILAGLDHPGIARLLDGGVAPDGRPYMAMEYVAGQDIATWCRDRKLDLAARLELIGQICDAVGYAHTRLVVHRDLKPHNVFVTEDGFVKLLDFGIARLLAVDGAVDATRTQTLLTPEYASPEQLDGEPVSLATDVYGLGLLMFELLTGSSPWRHRDSNVPTMIRRILDGDAPPPSRIAAIQDKPPVPAKQLRGDLDAIVLKALRREPAQRYETAAVLWADIERHRLGEPVLARQATARYVFGRYLRRHRWLMSTAAAVLLSLLAGLAAVLWQARQTAAERDRAQLEVERAHAVQDYLRLMFRTAASPGQAEPVTAKALLDRSAATLMERYQGDPTLRVDMLLLLGELYSSLSDYPGALPLLSRYESLPEVRAEPSRHADALLQLATLYARLGRIDEARSALDRAQQIWSDGDYASWDKLSASRSAEVEIAFAADDPTSAIASLRQALAERDEHRPEGDDTTVEMLNTLAIILLNTNQLDDARVSADRGWAIMQRIGRDRSSEGLTLMNTRASIAALQLRHDESIALFRQAIDLRRELYGPSDSLAVAMTNLANVLIRNQHGEEALKWLDEAQPMALQYSGPNSASSLGVMTLRGDALLLTGDLAAAEKASDETVQTFERLKGRDSLEYMRSLITVVGLRLAQQRYPEARAAQAELEMRAAKLGAPAQINARRIAALRERVDKAP